MTYKRVAILWAFLCGVNLANTFTTMAFGAEWLSAACFFMSGVCGYACHQSTAKDD